jgi:PAS domain S-box-containing protein
MTLPGRPSSVSRERRILLLAPVGRDAELTRRVLGEAGIEAAICPDLPMLVRELDAGAGALMLSEDALGGDLDLALLSERLMRQPPWSDLPILLLTHQGADSTVVRKAVRNLGNVTLLERPVRLASLVTAARTALRARARQYHAREHLQDLDHIARALAESEGRLKALFANVAVGIAELSAGGRFALVNDALVGLLGETRETLVGLPMAQVAHPEERAEVEGALRRVMGGLQDVFEAERRFLRSDGSTIWVKLSIARVRDVKAPEHRCVAVIEDVTERKHAEEDLREADRRKDEFLATLAHELRNPLAPIRNSLHIFRMAGIQDPKVERVADMMERQVAHMVRMVDDLLEVSRISRGKIELRKERVELASILRSAVDTSRPLIDAGEHRLGIHVPAEALVLAADPVRLSQVFANLLNNSAKYTPAGGEIAVNVTVDQGMAVVAVRDNGEGIPPQMLARVFNMFTQVNTGSRAQGGLGIGLTLARTLVQLHGGSIEARSEGRGRGCEFIVRLPLADGAAAAQSAHAGPAAEAPGRLKRVLVVDDNHDAADSLGMLLQFLGAEVAVAHDGPGALERMRAFRPEVVLLDLGMPGMNGLEVAKRMREDPIMRGITLVALTGWGQREDRRRTHEAGFDYHLVKPADVSTLQNILTQSELPASGVRH